MEEILRAIGLLFVPESELARIIGVTLQMAFFSTVLSVCIGVPLGMLLGMFEFRGKRLVLRVLNTLMGLPPVLAGLVVFFLLSRSGPLGSLRLLYTVSAMVIAQVVLITPIVCGLAATAVSAVAPQIRETCAGFGLSRKRELACLLYECRPQLLSLVFVAFGRSIGEVGAVMLVGGNVQYKTRVMTTAIMLETNKGNFEFAIALGIVLLLISFTINAIALSFDGKGAFGRAVSQRVGAKGRGTGGGPSAHVGAGGAPSACDRVLRDADAEVGASAGSLPAQAHNAVSDESLGGVR